MTDAERTPDYFSGWDAACDAIANRFTLGHLVHAWHMTPDAASELVVRVRHVVRDVELEGLERRVKAMAARSETDPELSVQQQPAEPRDRSAG